jgi:predicted ribosome quality control (RQC) complex YloA/Tae2 family protein
MAFPSSKAMQKMSGLDLSFVCLELAPLQGKRVAKIRRTGRGAFLFKIGGEELLFEPGVRLHLTRLQLSATERPDGFVALLRKRFEGKTAQAMRQHGSDRILEIEARSKERLVFELFRKGNLILVGEDGIIEACSSTEEAGGRKIARGEQYIYPKATPFEIKRPDKVGFFVQENAQGEPVSFSCDAASGGRQFPSFSEAADSYYANLKEETGEQKAAAEKIEKLQRRLEAQEKTLAALGKEKEGARQAGEAIYANFELVERLLERVRQLKKSGASEGEINRELSKSNAKLKGAQLDLEL